MQSAITLKEVTKRFGTPGNPAEACLAVAGVSLEVGETEFLTMVGPSGCGKSTLMRLIAGLEGPTSGDIYIKGERVNDLPIRSRNIGFMFQGYALFKHMTVADNIAFGLKIKKASRKERTERTAELVSLMGLSGLESRKPGQLSGGQQQRVALARALAPRPSLLLLDEPFGAVDAKVRQKLRADTKKLQRELKVPTILVTHDQREALELGDRMAVMSNGLIEQIDTPARVYDCPATELGARFIGRVNVFATELGPGCGRVIKGTQLQIMVRPEDFGIHPVNGRRETGNGHIPGRVAGSTFLGRTVRLEVELRGGRSVTVAVPRHEALMSGLSTGMEVTLTVEACQVFPRNGAGLGSVKEA